MYLKAFETAGFVFAFESEREIEDSDGFSAFLTEKEPELTIYVTEQELPAEKGKLIFERETHRAFELNGEIRFYSSYFDYFRNEYITYACFTTGGKTATLYLTPSEKLWDSKLVNAIDFPSMLLCKGAAFLHCSYIEDDCKAILFTARKGIGKSTQAALWEKHCNSLVINGDRALLKIENDEVFAFGTPYRGSSKISLNKTLPVKAIVCLAQAKENRIERLTGINAVLKLLDGTGCNPEIPELSEAATSICERIVSLVPVYYLECTPDERAVQLLFNTLESEIN